MNTSPSTARTVRNITLHTLVRSDDGSTPKDTVFTICTRPKAAGGEEIYRLGNRRAKVAKVSLECAVEMARAQEPLADPLMHDVCFEVQPALSDQPLCEPVRGALRAALVVADRLARGVDKLPRAAEAPTSLWLLTSLSNPGANQWELPELAQQSALCHHLTKLDSGPKLVLVAQAPTAHSPLFGLPSLVLPPLCATPSGSLAGAALREATVNFAVLQGEQPAQVCPITVRLQAGGGHFQEQDVVKVHNGTSPHQRQAIMSFIKRLRQSEEDRDSDVHWVTHVVLPDLSFSEDSYQLALALADRMARGREWTGPGRVFATGRVNIAEMPGRVETVVNVSAGLDPSSPHSKVRAFFNEAGLNDCILLPDDWLQDAGVQGHIEKTLQDAEAQLKRLPQIVYVKSVLPLKSP